MSARGKVFLIGGGPGDPELVTRKAVRCLGLADLVLYDALAHPELLRHCRPEAERVFVGKRAGRVQQRQASINERLIEAARQGRVVARLKGGDPFLFGRGSEEAEALAAAGIAFEVVPGIASPSAAAAYAGMSLTHRDLASSVAYLTATESPEKDGSAHDWAKLATATQTLVIFMGVRHLEATMQRLMQHGRPGRCPAAVVQGASTAAQRTVVGTVSDIARKARDAGIGTPALTIVGEVVRLREKLRWFDVQPLFGKRVLVTRAQGQADSWSARLREVGAEPVELPMIRIAPPDDPEPLRAAASRLREYDFVVLTSHNGVAALFAALDAAGSDARAFANARVAAIGPATAEALRQRGVRADVVPPSYRGEALAAEILATGNVRRVLLPRAVVARDVLPETLRAAGVHVDVVAAYQTLGPSPEHVAQLRERLSAGDLDIATFTSSSTVTRLVDALGPEAAGWLSGLTVASIGPITTETARAHALRVDVTAETYTTDGLLAALTRHFTENAR